MHTPRTTRSTRTMTRNTLAVVAGAAALTGLLGVGPAGAAVVKNQNVLITNQGIDLGNGSWVWGAPVGSANLAWDKTGVVIRPHLTGTLHLDDVAQEWGRVHIGFYNTGGASIASPVHTTAHKATDNSHHEYAVDSFPAGYSTLDHVQICTELSGDNVSYSTVGCKIYYF